MHNGPFLRLLATGVVLLAMLPAAWGRPLGAQDARPIFPTIQGRNLEERELELPAEFAGERNVVLVAFKQRQQREVNSWLPALGAMRKEAGNVEVYEIPTLHRGWTPLRGWIDGGMRSGIPDRATREATITVYINKAPFKAALGITSESRIHVLLLDRDGRVVHRELGSATPAGVQRLRQALGLPSAPP
jgi:hypothetical protein